MRLACWSSIAALGLLLLASCATARPQDAASGSVNRTLHTHGSGCGHVQVGGRWVVQVKDVARPGKF